MNNFLRDPEMTWFRDNLPSARGVLIVPTFVRAGFIFGGAGGNGVLMVHDNSRDWSYPAFYTVASGSVGFQAGAEVAEVILMIRSQRGADAMLSNSFKLGADASVAAGPIGAGAQVQTSDILAFSRSKGLYGGVNLDGSAIAPRDAWNSTYYGRQVRPVDILVSRNVSNPQADRLRNRLSRNIQS
ncbi:lipid-binding SYLF domain-containing protein [Skermanella aerolata]|uniref:lipid-binding SYLF domain-containing protein n=1 Tax=Skermanella aerolata TaxID=393310 RepID=UPI003D251796